MRARRPWAWKSDDLAVDLGTANTVIFRREEGVILFEPSVVAVDERGGRVQAVGEEARRMIGRTPATIRATRPLRHGVIADIEMGEQMLRYFLARVQAGRWSRLRVIVPVPGGITGVERQAVEEAAIAAGASRAFLMEEPMAGAIGAGLPVADPVGSLIVDIGGGTSEMAVISLGGMVISESLRVGGYELDEAIVRYVNEMHRLQIGQEQAERLKIDIGSAWPLRDTLTAQVAGRDRTTGLLRRAQLSGGEVRDAIARPIEQIVAAVKDTLERTPPELAADIIERGLTLVGGGALLPGIDQLMRAEIDVEVHVADDALITVARGAGVSIDEIARIDERRR